MASMQRYVWKRMKLYTVDTLLICTLWYEFSNNVDAQSDFGNFFVTNKRVPWNHIYLKYLLNDSHVFGIQSSRCVFDLTSAIFLASFLLAFGLGFGCYDTPNFERFRWRKILRILQRNEFYQKRLDPLYGEKPQENQ